jgi:hypothetical protein
MDILSVPQGCVYIVEPASLAGRGQTGRTSKISMLWPEMRNARSTSERIWGGGAAALDKSRDLFLNPFLLQIVKWH